MRPRQGVGRGAPGSVDSAVGGRPVVDAREACGAGAAARCCRMGHGFLPSRHDTCSHRDRRRRPGGGPLFDTPAALARADELLRETGGRRGAEVVVFPEAFVGGYPKGLDFGVPVGSRTPQGRDLFRRYHAAAIEVPGPEVAALAAVTRELGWPRRGRRDRAPGGTLYCVALFFGPDGYLGLHRKLMPTAAERCLWGQGDGSTLPVIDTGAGRLGAAICWKNYMPLFRTAM